jgi:hypothetical protein
MKDSVLQTIDSIASGRRAVIAGRDDDIVEVVKAAIRADLSVSFYLTKVQTEAVRSWYWTAERIEFTGLKPVSEEEDQRIQDELGLKITNFRYAPFDCDCGHRYGAFEFLQQGVRQHGVESVKSVFSLENATLFQINPTFVPVCPSCGKELGNNMKMRGGGWYDCDGYGGCCCCADLVGLRP